MEITVESIDNCAGELPITSWLIAPGNTLIPAGTGPVALAFESAMASHCEPGIYHATLLLHSLDGNVPDRRVEVVLEITSAIPSLPVWGLGILSLGLLGAATRITARSEARPRVGVGE